MMWEASAPSNIALVKYMGKLHGGNVAMNASLSWTLEHLRTFVQMEIAEDDTWEPHPQFKPLNMSAMGLQKYLKHLNLMKSYFNAETFHFTVRSANNFPSDCGIASSASSFAALTLCAAKALSGLTQKPMPTLEVLADLSRQGSGSSCRSFFKNFVVWEDNRIYQTPSTVNEMIHQVVIVSGTAKTVSSSQAHSRVQTSSLIQGRIERAQMRFCAIADELKSESPNWKNLYENTWADFWDMHALFETSHPPFGYMQKESLEVLNICRGLWDAEGDGPLITMDAGPNVHLMWRMDQKSQSQKFIRNYGQFQIIEGFTS